MKTRHDLKNRFDSISLQDIDDSNEWLVREMGANLQDAEDKLVFENDRLTWGDVARASGAGELQTYTRQMSKRKMSAKASSSAPAIIEDIENETYFNEGVEGQEEEDKFNEDDLCENDDNIDYDE